MTWGFLISNFVVLPLHITLHLPCCCQECMSMTTARVCMTLDYITFALHHISHNFKTTVLTVVNIMFSVYSTKGLTHTKSYIFVNFQFHIYNSNLPSHLDGHEDQCSHTFPMDPDKTDVMINFDLIFFGLPFSQSIHWSTESLVHEHVFPPLLLSLCMFWWAFLCMSASTSSSACACSCACVPMPVHIYGCSCAHKYACKYYCACFCVFPCLCMFLYICLLLTVDVPYACAYFHVRFPACAHLWMFLCMHIFLCMFCVFRCLYTSVHIPMHLQWHVHIPVYSLACAHLCMFLCICMLLGPIPVPMDVHALLPVHVPAVHVPMPVTV